MGIKITSLCLLLSTQGVLADDFQQEFTYLSEPAYLQEIGEWQFNTQINTDAYSQPNQHKMSGQLSIEYGITDDLQLELGTQWQHEREDGIFEDESEYEVALSYHLMAQNSGYVDASIESGLVFEESDIGYEIRLLSSYALAEDQFVHFNVGFESLDNAQTTSIAGSYVHVFDNELGMLLEFEKSWLDNHDSSIAAFGFVYEVLNDVEVGAAYLHYFDDVDLDYSVTFKVSYEF